MDPLKRNIIYYIFSQRDGPGDEGLAPFLFGDEFMDLKQSLDSLRGGSFSQVPFSLFFGLVELLWHSNMPDFAAKLKPDFDQQLTAAVNKGLIKSNLITKQRAP